MMRDSAAARTVRWVLIGIGLLLPVLTLVPIGSFWLWQNGYLLWWALAAVATTVTAWGVQRWLLRPRTASARSPLPADIDQSDLGAGADPAWTPAELAAWRKVLEIAKATDADALTNREAATQLGIRTVEVVALAIHPDRRDPLLQFTAPEALALIEHVSHRMNAFITQNIPLGDKLTVAQMTALYRQRGLLAAGEKAYDVWRAIRLLNPATALASEVRERLSKEMMAWGKDQVMRRLVAVYVEEVGRAAIDLYGGRLRVSEGALAEHVSSKSARDLAAGADEVAEPLRLFVAGQTSTGKSSLVNALAAEVRAAVDALPATNSFKPYSLQRDGLPAALIVDSPGLTPNAAQREALVEELASCDLVLWVCAANRADRELDRQALDAVRAYFAAHTNRRRPPMLLVLTHVDRLRPFQDWSPPYDVNDATSPKAASMRAAIEAASSDLGFATGDVVPVCLAAEHERYNLDAVWAAIADRLPQAQANQLVRTLRDAEGVWDWSHIWAQAKSGGRVLVRKIS